MLDVGYWILVGTLTDAGYWMLVEMLDVNNLKLYKNIYHEKIIHDIFSKFIGADLRLVPIALHRGAAQSERHGGVSIYLPERFY
jgi:hypothetical protein